MEKLIDTARDIEAVMSKERGEFDLFGLFRKRRGIHWDLIVAAPWIGPFYRPTLDLIVERLQQGIGASELLLLGGVIISPDPAFVDAVASAVTVEHGLEVVGPGEYGRVDIARGYVITCRRPAVAAA